MAAWRFASSRRGRRYENSPSRSTSCYEAPLALARRSRRSLRTRTASPSPLGTRRSHWRQSRSPRMAPSPHVRPPPRREASRSTSGTARDEMPRARLRLRAHTFRSSTRVRMGARAIFSGSRRSPHRAGGRSAFSSETRHPKRASISTLAAARCCVHTLSVSAGRLRRCGGSGSTARVRRFTMLNGSISSDCRAEASALSHKCRSAHRSTDSSLSRSSEQTRATST